MPSPPISGANTSASLVEGTLGNDEPVLTDRRWKLVETKNLVDFVMDFNNDDPKCIDAQEHDKRS